MVGDKPLEIEGYGTMPPLSQFIPGFKDPINYFGIFVPKGVPAEVTATLDKMWAGPIAQNEALKKYAQNRGALVRAVAWRSGAGRGVPGDPVVRLGPAGRRQGQGVARHGRHRQALSQLRGAATRQPAQRTAADRHPGCPTGPFRPSLRPPGPTGLYHVRDR